MNNDYNCIYFRIFLTFSKIILKYELKKNSRKAFIYLHFTLKIIFEVHFHTLLFDNS